MKAQIRILHRKNSIEWFSSAKFHFNNPISNESIADSLFVSFYFYCNFLSTFLFVWVKLFVSNCIASLYHFGMLKFTFTENEINTNVSRDVHTIDALTAVYTVYSTCI